MSRASAHRQGVLEPVRPPRPRRGPVNRLSQAERARILVVLNSDRFVDTTPTEVFATLLDEGAFLASVATLYRVLREIGRSWSVAVWPGTRPAPGRS